MSSVNQESLEAVLNRVQPIPVLHSKDRITLSFQINYEHRPDDPITLGKPAHLFLKGTEDQPEISKRYTLDQEWQKIRLGDLDFDNVSVIIVENVTGKGALTKPTDEEKADIEKRVMEILFHTPHPSPELNRPLLIPVGWPFFALPRVADSIYLRSQHGEAKGRISLFPK